MLIALLEAILVLIKQVWFLLMILLDLGLNVNWSGLHTGNLSWQTRVGRLQNVGRLAPSHVKLNNANLHYGRSSAVAPTQSCRLCLGLILLKLITRDERESNGEI